MAIPGSKISLQTFIHSEKHIAPLTVFRIAFGLIMLISTVRFMARGWIYEFYILPKYYFTFPGFHWVKPLGAAGMYLVFGIMAIACLFIMLGLFYRFSTLVFFLSFTYVELIDKTNYLNHYYFVSIVSFLLLLVPAHRYFSLDAALRPRIKRTHVPAWTINIFKLQLCIVYFFSGLAKINYDWLIAAQPLGTWLPANEHLPLIGAMLTWPWIAVFFSWFGAVYDLTIWYFLLNSRTRPVAYVFVVIFHVFTAWFFKIGMFPYIMMALTIIFFSESFHKKLIEGIGRVFGVKTRNEMVSRWQISVGHQAIMFFTLGLYFCIQFLLPFRYLLYPGKLFWTEEGYRFSWRVMLMEKGGTAFFYIKDPGTGRKTEVINSAYLTPLQEKMMVTQPDMILQFAHYLSAIYKSKGIKDPVVTVQSYVTLNGSGSRLFIDSAIDLSKQTEGFRHYSWVLPFQNTNQK